MKLMRHFTLISNFFGLWAKKVWTLVGKFFFSVVTTAVRECKETFWGFLSDKFLLSFFGVWATIFSSLGKETIQMCRKNNLRVQREMSGKLTLKRCFFYSFRTKSRQTWMFGGNLMARFSKLYLTWPSVKTSGKKTFEQIFLPFFCILTWKKFSGNFLAGLSKLNSMCPEEHFWSKVFGTNCLKF